MNTINIILELRKELSNQEYEEIERIIERTGYCEIIRTYGTNEFEIVLSYFKYFSDTNTFLIKDAEECSEVQEDFIKLLEKSSVAKDIDIRIIGVNVSFNYLMDIGEDIYCYKNIFKLCEEVYKRKGLVFSSKKDILISEKYGTVIYSDKYSNRGYSQKVMIYSQWEELKKEYDINKFRNICEDFPNLKRIMRIKYSVSVSKDRELGKIMTLNEFKKFNGFDMFVSKATEYMLDNFFNEEEIEKVLIDETSKLSEKFYGERKRKKIDYEKFIYKNIDSIVDYQVIRKVLNQIENIKTKEGAITNIRKLIYKYETENRVIVMNTYDKIKKMINFFKRNKL